MQFCPPCQSPNLYIWKGDLSPTNPCMLACWGHFQCNGNFSINRLIRIPSISNSSGCILVTSSQSCNNSDIQDFWDLLSTHACRVFTLIPIHQTFRWRHRLCRGAVFERHSSIAHSYIGTCWIKCVKVAPHCHSASVLCMKRANIFATRIRTQYEANI